MRTNPPVHSIAQSSTSSPVTPQSPGAEVPKKTDQGLLSMMPCLERQDKSRNESIRPRSAQSLAVAQDKGTAVGDGGLPAGRKNAIENLFVCDSGLISLLNASASGNPGLMDNIWYLCENGVKINLSHKDSGRLGEDVHDLLAEAPMALKCVLSDENQRERPSLYIKEGADGQSPEIAYASSRKDSIPLDDLAFAINVVSAWRKNNRVWPGFYANFQPPKDVPPELISGIDETPTSYLRQRGDVCDLSDAGFKPYHGEDAPHKVTARVITIKAAQGDNKTVANAIEEHVHPGDVVLVDGGGHSACAVLGGIIGSLAGKVRGVKGILVYGELRDQAELKALSIPVFGLGASPNGPSKVGPGSVHCSLDIGNIPFKSGDIIKIDRDQIVVVPCENAASILDSRGLEDGTRAAQNAFPIREGRSPMRPRKTFELLEKKPPKNRARPETPSFIPELFKGYAPAQICDVVSFMDSGRLWGAGADMAWRMGAIPDGVTLTGAAVLSSGSEKSIVSALDKAKKGDFLIVSDDSEVKLAAAVMEKIHAAGISCIVIAGKAVIDEGVRKQYDIPCFAKSIDATGDLVQKTSKNETRPLGCIELSDGFIIKPGYVMMADVDGISGFSPTKFSTLYRAGYKKSIQEKASGERNKLGHAYPLPRNSIVTDRYYEPFVHAYIDQMPFVRSSRGIATMQLPVDPTEVQVSRGDQKIKLRSDEALEGVPEKITTHGEGPMTFTLRNKEGEIQEVEGVSGRGLFEVALAVERKESIEVRSDGSIGKQ